MKFIIERTSLWDDKKPCKEAQLYKFKYWETRTCTEEEFNDRYSNKEGLWRSKGEKHTVDEKGYITRQMGYQNKWCVEIKTLEELMEFIKKYGIIVIGEYFFDVKTHTIEIYDDYRE